MSDSLLPSTTARLLARLARAQREARAPGLVAGLVRGSELVWSAARGDVAEPHADVQHRLGSITKTVTAVAVMRLRDEGLLVLDDPLERHVPGTPVGDRTVGQLLSHTAGADRREPRAVVGAHAAAARSPTSAWRPSTCRSAPAGRSTTPTSATACSASCWPRCAGARGTTSCATRCCCRSA